MAKPKLALIPAAQGSKFYSVLPSSGVGDFDFTRSGSATRINSQGLIETVGNGVSRLNYPLLDGKVVGCPSHILEPQRTNSVTYSEDFSQSYWTKSGSNVTSGFISPDGTANAFKLVESNVSEPHRLQSGTVTNTSYTFSVFAKKSNRFLQIIGNLSQNDYVNFDLDNGIIGSNGGGVTNINIQEYANGFYRCSGTITLTSLSIGLSSSINAPYRESYQGNGTSGVYIYGAMLEQGSYPTSYIPTNGSTVTRSAEVANGSGDASTFNDSEGVLMAEISALANDGTSRRLTLSDGSISNRISLEFDETANVLKVFSITTGITVLQYTAQDLTLFNKISVKYKLNDFALWLNGFEVDTNNSVLTPSGLDRLNFDGGDLNNDFYGNTKQIQYYDSALTNSELETLTSWVSFSDMANGQLYTIE